MRRPLSVGLLLFLAVYLAVSGMTGWGKSGGLKKTGSDAAEIWSGKRVQVTGEAVGLYEPADGSQENISFTLQNITMLSDTGSDISEEESESIFKNKSIVCKLKEEERLPRAGSHVRVIGTVMPFLGATNPGEFDAKAYYERQGVLFSLTDAEILAQSGTYDRIEDFLYRLKYRTAVFYHEILGEEDGAVASAMVLGIKKGMDAQMKTLYQDAGIAHVLAISGLHITLIGMAFFRALKRVRLPLPLAAVLAAAGILAFGKMVGMGVSTKRAVVMFFLALAAQLIKRTPDTVTSLTLAACLILLKNPAQLQDSGFWLSFLAVAGAAAVVPVLQEKGITAPDMEESRWKKLLKGAGKSLTASFGITLATLPAMLYFFYKWNPWSVLANLIVIPLMGALLLWLLFLGAACWLFSGISYGMIFLKLMALPAQGIFFVYEKICRAVLALPGSSLHTGTPAVWQVTAFAAGMAGLLLLGRKMPPKPRLAYAVCLSMIFMLRMPGRLTVTMLDVGQGECVCVETRQHHFYLLDAGSSSKRKAGQYQIIPFLEYSGVRRLDGIFISHWDADHVNALEEIFEWARTDHVKIKRLFLPDTSLLDDGLEKLLALAGEYGIDTERIRAGQRFEDHGMELFCLHPCQGETAADRNGISTVLRLSFGEFSALFTGDLEKEGEEWLTEHYGKDMLDCSLLDAGHHGSANASTQTLLEAVSPQAVLISCGRNNSYGHPAQETLERIAAAGASCYVTAQNGAVTVTVKEDGMWIRTFAVYVNLYNESGGLPGNVIS